jgi:hypothetical protein
VLRGNCPLRIIGRAGDWLNVTTAQDDAALQGWVFSAYVAQDIVARAASGAPAPGMLLRTQWQDLLPVISERAVQLIVSCEVTSEAGALVSLVYNRGPAFNNTDARHTEMRAIRDDVASAQLDDVPHQLRLMKRLWANDSNMAGLVARRESEAVLFEEGLQAAADRDQTPSLIS